MDLISTRTIDITKLALDGLILRQKAITANTANVMTPDYQRKEVSFESQLKEIITKSDLQTMLKEQNSIQFNPSSLDTAVSFDRPPNQLSKQQAKYLQSDIYGDYNPQITDDTISGKAEDGNNVDIETEMMGMAKVGTQYSVLSNLEQRAFKNTLDVIKGQ